MKTLYTKQIIIQYNLIQFNTVKYNVIHYPRMQCYTIRYIACEAHTYFRSSLLSLRREGEKAIQYKALK